MVGSDKYFGYLRDLRDDDDDVALEHWFNAHRHRF